MDYRIDTDRIQYREEGYRDFWGCEPDLVLHQTDAEIPHIDVYRFPPVPNSESDYYVYLSGGMSDLVQPGTEPYDLSYQRVEVSLFSKKLITTHTGKTDFLGWICGWMAHYPFNQKTYFVPGQTFDWGSPIVENSEMCGFYFAHLPWHDAHALCEASGTAKNLVHLIPLSARELEFTSKEGKEALLEVLERGRVSPICDFGRRSCI